MENTQEKTGETTYLEPETLKPEQMESGKWYFVKIVYDWLLKFDYYEDGDEPRTFAQRIISLDDGMDYTSIGSYTGGKAENIRLATKAEVLKYFPDEKFEPIEKGCPFDENVSLINEVNNTQVPEQQNQKWSEKIDEIMDKHVVQKLKPEPIELQQNNQEKVYIHFNSKRETWLQAESLELALQQSEDNKNIYEAIKIGVKKSILVNENS